MHATCALGGSKAGRQARQWFQVVVVGWVLLFEKEGEREDWGEGDEGACGEHVCMCVCARVCVAFGGIRECKFLWGWRGHVDNEDN